MLDCTALYHVVLQDIMYINLHSTKLCFTIDYTILRDIVLRYTALYYIVLG